MQSTIYMVVAESSNLFLDIVGGLKERRSKFLCERGFCEDDEEVKNLLETFEHCEVPYRQLRNNIGIFSTPQ